MTMKMDDALETRWKVELLCEAAGLGMRPVPDPYYGGNEGFQNVFDLVKTACHRIAEQWKGNHE